MDDGVGADLHLNDLGVTADSIAWEFEFAVEDPTGRVWFTFAMLEYSGSEALTQPLTYGGGIYPAGTKFESEGFWQWIEFGGALNLLSAQEIRLYLGLSLAVNYFGLEQTNESFQEGTLMIGPVMCATTRVLHPTLEVGIDGGLWFGGRPRGEAFLGVDSESFAWSVRGTLWVGWTPTEHFSVRVGYLLRKVQVETTLETAPFWGPAWYEDRDLDLLFGGPFLSVQFRF